MLKSLTTSPSAVDEVFDHYLSWREETAALATAYERWRRADESARAPAFTAYRAQLDLEEKAAQCYEQCVASARV
jgi:hypothetical protein